MECWIFLEFECETKWNFVYFCESECETKWDFVSFCDSECETKWKFLYVFGSLSGIFICFSQSECNKVGFCMFLCV